MGREIRRVPGDWEHPKYTEADAPLRNLVGEYRPLYDEDYETAANEWLANLALWQRGEHPSQPSGYGRYFWEYDAPPDEDTHRDRKWSADEATHFQMYETVSEGSPVTPSFATTAELVNYLVEIGDFWDQSRGTGGWKREAAKQFVETGWAPSMVVTVSADHTTIAEPRDGSPP